MAVSLPQTDDAARTITVLGSTGSVGRSTLDLVSRNPERYAVEALTANVNETLLAEQARRFRPRLTVIAEQSRYPALKAALAGTVLTIEAGRDAVI